MKPLNSKNSYTSNIVKQLLYGFQVVIIALAIPVLSYLKLSHKDNKADIPQKNNTEITTVKQEGMEMNRQFFKSI